MDGASRRGGPHVDAKLYDDPAEDLAGVGGPRGGVGATPTSRASIRRLAGVGGRGGRRPSGRATTCATCASCCDGTATTPPSTATSARAACTRRIDFDFLRRRASRNYRAFMEDAGDLVASLRRLALRRARRRPGARGAAAARCSARRSSGVREFKAIWDPDGQMNPGKVVDPYPLDANLRLGADYRPPSWRRTSLPRRRRQLRARHRALRRRRRVPPRPRAARCARATGHARGEALHARPRAAAVRDAAQATRCRAGGATRRSRRRSTCAWPARAASTSAR